MNFLTNLFFLGVIVLMFVALWFAAGWVYAVVTAGPKVWFWMVVIFLFVTGVRS